MRVLNKLGFSCEKARARRLQVWETVDGTSLERIGHVDHHDSEQKFGAALYAVHRIDLHNELLRLISQESGDKKAVELHLRSKVIDVKPEEGIIELEDGTIHHADLIVAADGVHSVLRSLLLGDRNLTAKKTGLSAFRFLIPTPKLEEEPLLTGLRQWKASGVTIFADTKDTVNERHMVWYDCQEYASTPLI